MEEKKRNCKAWIREHKANLAIVGASIGTVVATYIGVYMVASVKTMDAVKEVSGKETIDVLNNLPNTSKKTISRAAHKVRMHPRKLPVGHKPSPEKVELALKNGYILLPNQTFVEEYITREKMAC